MKQMNEDKYVVLLDMDGPLADFDGMCMRMAHRYSWPLDIPSIGRQTHRFFTDHLVKPAHRRAMRAQIESPGWFVNLPPVAGAIEHISELVEHFDVWVCSKPLNTPWCASEKVEWINRYFPELSDKIILAPDKGMVKGNVLIDDAIQESQLAYAEWEPLVYPVPYNMNAHQPKLVNPMGPDGTLHYDVWSWGDSIDRIADAGERAIRRQREDGNGGRTP